jgi:hypothetical protein
MAMKPLDALKKILHYSRFIIAICVGLAIYHFFLPSKTVYVQKPVPVYDSARVAEASQRYQKLLADTVASFTEKILGLKQRQQPTGYYGKLDPLPINLGVPIKYGHDSLVTYTPLAFDVPIALEATSSQVSITTENPANAARGEPAVKLYQWPRLTRDFFFAIAPTNDYSALNGINLVFKKRAFEFDGFGIIAGIGYPKQYYAGVDARFIFWEQLELTPRLLSTQASIEARWKF